MRTIFVGDIHGCAEEFSDMLQQVRFHIGRDRLFLTGDAFTKGPDPLGVWHLIQEHDAKMVMGNHDDALLEKIKLRQKNKEKEIKPDHSRILDAMMPVVDDLIPWLKALPLFIEEDSFLLVHAGINPKKELVGTTRDEFLVIRTWPPQKGIDGPRWHAFYKPIRPLLVFGHDAPRGLVVKRDEKQIPFLVGLDSGCVYGQSLSAYILEEQFVVQVDSHQPKVFFDS